MTINEYGNLKSNTFVEYRNDLGIYKNDSGIHSILLQGNEQIELSVIELIKNVSLSDIEMKKDGFYLIDGEVVKIHFRYDTMDCHVLRNKETNIYNDTGWMEINKQNMISITENETLKVVNEILNRESFERPGS